MTSLQIWNMALGFIGVSPLRTISDSSYEADQCRLYWDMARRTTLRDYQWNFAIMRKKLNSATLPLEYKGEYSYAYSLPIGCVKLIKILPSNTDSSLIPVRIKAERAKIVNVSNTRIVLSNIPNAMADYIGDVDNADLWDESFCLCMARKMACLICTPILKDSAKLQGLEVLYQASLPCAILNNAKESVISGINDDLDSWLTLRQTGDAI